MGIVVGQLTAMEYDQPSNPTITQHFLMKIMAVKNALPHTVTIMRGPDLINKFRNDRDKNRIATFNNNAYTFNKAAFEQLYFIYGGSDQTTHFLTPISSDWSQIAIDWGLGFYIFSKSANGNDIYLTKIETTEKGLTPSDLKLGTVTQAQLQNGIGLDVKVNGMIALLEKKEVPWLRRGGNPQHKIPTKNMTSEEKVTLLNDTWGDLYHQRISDQELLNEIVSSPEWQDILYNELRAIVDALSRGDTNSALFLIGFARNSYEPREVSY